MWRQGSGSTTTSAVGSATSSLVETARKAHREQKASHRLLEGIGEEDAEEKPNRACPLLSGRARAVSFCQGAQRAPEEPGGRLIKPTLVTFSDRKGRVKQPSLVCDACSLIHCCPSPPETGKGEDVTLISKKGWGELRGKAGWGSCCMSRPTHLHRDPRGQPSPWGAGKCRGSCVGTPGPQAGRVLRREPGLAVAARLAKTHPTRSFSRVFWEAGGARGKVLAWPGNWFQNRKQGVGGRGQSLRWQEMAASSSVLFQRRQERPGKGSE